MKDDFRPAPAGGETGFVPISKPPAPATPPLAPNPPVQPVDPFQPPEAPAPPPPAHTPKLLEPPKKGLKKWLDRWHHLSKKQQIIIGSMVAGLLIAAGLIWWFVFRSKPAPPPPPVQQVIEKPKPKTVPSRLTGVQVKPKLDKMPTTGVMIENSPDARPQSGLYDAGVVFEAIAEGGITRFLALYQTEKPEYIGPVRSVRPYYLDFLAPFDAPIAHAGGSGVALAQLRAQRLKDLEAFQNPAYYQRVSTRYAPHNLYTGRSRLLSLQKKKGWGKSKFKGFVRKEESRSKKPKAKKISLALSGFLYNPEFDYISRTNSYLRRQAGKPHVDEKAKRQINPKVVVALVMSHHYSGIYSVYGATGSGKAYVFQDGTVTVGTWRKAHRKAQFSFRNKQGKILGLNPGRTWVTIVSSPNSVSYKP